MNELTETAKAPSGVTLSIAAVERDTGLSKDTLRIWERRYGFPTPGRDTAGERCYPLDQIEKLRVIKRLMDAGHRPGRVVALPMAQLQVLTEQTVDLAPRGAVAALAGAGSADLKAHLQLIREHDMAGLRAALCRLQARVGLAPFLNDVVAPLNVAVGDAWLHGDLQLWEEHLYTETLQVLLRQAIAAVPPLPAPTGPRVLLTTFPGEPHTLGLLMAEAMLTLEGCPCVNLGTQTPPWDIVLATRACNSDIVALSFTACLNPNQVIEGLNELRAKLPPRVDLWAGGGAPVLHRRRLPGVQPFATLETVPAALAAWRAVASAASAASAALSSTATS